ncbi:MAG: hypothetical protein ABIB71_03205 [Candidatus Woesearchaeota archaeon]
MADGSIVDILKKAIKTATLPEDENTISPQIISKALSREKKPYNDDKISETVKDTLYELADFYFSLNENTVSLESFGNVIGNMSQAVYLKRLEGAKTERDPANKNMKLSKIMEEIRQDLVYDLGEKYLKASGKEDPKINDCLAAGMQYLNSIK